MVVRVNKNANYTVMSNYHLKDPHLSLKAKGLLSVVLSLPDDWQYSMSGFMAIAKEKESSISAALKELKENGYLIVTKKMPNQTNSGRIEYEWDFYECSCNPFRGSFEPTTGKQEPKKQGVENQGLEFQGLENQGQLNTNILNTKESNTNGFISIMDKPKNTRFVPPTVEEVRNYCDERNNDVDPEKFVAYYTSNGWKVGKNPMKDWKAAVRTWEKNSYGKPLNKPNGYKAGGNEFTALLERMEAEDE